MKLAFVIPWYGTNIPGGAETLCRTTAERLHRAGLEVEVLTTCVREFHSDWGVDFHLPGTEDCNGIPVRRFRVRRRDAIAFDEVNLKLMQGRSISPREATVFRDEMVRSDDLVAFMCAHRAEYVFILIPYMFGTTVFGAEVAPERSVLLPCLHNESYAYLGIYRQMFSSVRGVMLLSKSEQQLAQKIFGLDEERTALVGCGIDLVDGGDGERFRCKHGLAQYLLYAGRKDVGKNAPLLVDYFCRFKERHPSLLQLLLVGAGRIDIPQAHADTVRDLGFLSETDKHDAFAGAMALCQPSVNESFSIVVMEAWSARIPVLVHADCAPTRAYCLEANAGLYFSDFEEFETCLEFYIHHPRARSLLGANGRSYVEHSFTWPRVVDKYVSALERWNLLR